MTDPIADLLTRIRNAELAKHSEVIAPYSKMKEAVVKVLLQYKYIVSYENKQVEGKNFKNIILKLDNTKKYKTHYKSISTPGQRIYINSEDIKTIKSGLGISIISTSKGIMSNIEAKKEKVGGEVLCEIW